ncbi:MAG: D-aminoacylase [Calditrichaeota bacterium]|nr:MAG: D-aminoacylase [Calditrichota bacterium]
MRKIMQRRRFIKNSLLGIAAAATLPSTLYSQSRRADFLIRNVNILDGLGNPSYRADVLIRGARIVDIGKFSTRQARQTIDADGLHLAPGFIDMHSHSDDDIFLYPHAESKVYQGVTTEVTGNCGYSAAPVRGRDAEQRRRSFKKDGIQREWSDVASYRAALDKNGMALNQTLLVGQGTLRKSIAGLDDRPLSPSELEEEQNALALALEHGAAGFSSGLEYTPGTFTPTSELIALARVAARYDRLYATHMRDEEQMLLEAISEALTIGRESGVRVQISHLKANGKANWSKQADALNMIEKARARGVDVMIDAYPYTAYSTSLVAFLPAWAREGGKTAQRLQQSDLRAKILKETDAKVTGDLGGYDLIVISSVSDKKLEKYIGLSMETIAAQWQQTPAEALLAFLEQDDFATGFVGHGMRPENVEMVLAHPLTMIGSDGVTQAPYGPAAKDRPHPRSYGTFARVLAYYCRERRLFDLPTAVKKMTSMPADQLMLKDRGRIAPGMMADLVIFDFDKVKDTATFSDPHHYAQGFEYLFVNGETVLEKGTLTKALPGKLL